MGGYNEKVISLIVAYLGSVSEFVCFFTFVFRTHTFFTFNHVCVLLSSPLMVMLFVYLCSLPFDAGQIEDLWAQVWVQAQGALACCVNASASVAAFW